MIVLNFNVRNYTGGIAFLAEYITEDYGRMSGKYCSITRTNNSDDKVAYLAAHFPGEEQFDKALFEKAIERNIKVYPNCEYKITKTRTINS